MSSNPQAPAWLEPVLQTALRAWTLSCGTARGKISLAMVAGGIAIINQGWLQPLISAAWEIAFGRPIGFTHLHPLYGVLLVGLV